MLHSFTAGTPANRPVQFLSDDDIRRMAPSVFAEAAHESRSSRYSQIPTSRILDGLRAEGFQPVKVTAARVREAARDASLPDAFRHPSCNLNPASAVNCRCRNENDQRRIAAPLVAGPLPFPEQPGEEKEEKYSNGSIRKFQRRRILLP